jgi:hypothetical protein
MKKILSWDCANRSLAWTRADIDLEIKQKFRKIADEIAQIILIADNELTTQSYLSEAVIEQISDIATKCRITMRGFIKIHSIGVCDVLKGKKVTETTTYEKAKCLKNFLSTDPRVALTNNNPELVIVEIQPNRGMCGNGMSTTVSAQLVYHYVDHSPVGVSPKLKNNINLNRTYADHVNEMIPKYTSSLNAKYVARKNHSIENLLCFVQTFGLESHIKNIPKRFLDDAADSFWNMLAYLKENDMYS